MMEIDEGRRVVVLYKHLNLMYWKCISNSHPASDVDKIVTDLFHYSQAEIFDGRL